MHDHRIAASFFCFGVRRSGCTRAVELAGALGIGSFFLKAFLSPRNRCPRLKEEASLGNLGHLATCCCGLLVRRQRQAKDDHQERSEPNIFALLATVIALCLGLRLPVPVP